MTKLKLRHFKRKGGFSLVEVTLALGIMGFGMVGVMGLLPVGLTTFRDAMDRTVSAQIVQAVMNEYQLTDFEQLPASPPASFHDVEGQTFHADGSPVTAADAKYRVEVKFMDANLLGGVINPDMRRVQVSIIDEPSGRDLRIFSSMIAKRTK